MMTQKMAHLLRRIVRSLPSEVGQRIYHHLLHHRGHPLQGPINLSRVSVQLPAYCESDSMHEQMWWLGEYEHHLTLNLLPLAANGGLMVDVGANIGYFAILWLAARSANKTVAFEASSNVFNMLRANVELNGLTARANLYNLAVGREAGTMDFDPGSTTETGWGGLSLSNSGHLVRTQVVTLDAIFADLGEDIMVLKIDTEGADTWVLEGASDLLKARKIRHIYFEQNHARMAALGIKQGHAQALLQRFGYSVKELPGTEGSEFHAELQNF